MLGEDLEARARALLGCVLLGHGVNVQITEVEAYGGPDDAASHAYTRTPRSDIMYGRPWRLYTYLSYGQHVCANVVTLPTDVPSAVLLRAGRVVDGLPLARERRPGVKDDDLARGPGNLTRALGITMDDLGADLLTPGGLSLAGGQEPDFEVSSGPRVGISKAADVPWRFWITGDPTVSAYRRGNV